MKPLVVFHEPQRKASVSWWGGAVSLCWRRLAAHRTLMYARRPCMHCSHLNLRVRTFTLCVC